jgi:DNA polymerase-1
MPKNKLYLIDATAFCYRAFYALSGLSTSFGQPTNAIYGFINILNKIIKVHKPKFLAVCFDVSRDTFRRKKFADYKIQRPPMPEGLVSQIPLIKEIISAYGIPIYEKEGFEADDIIATLVKKAHQEDLGVTIVSSDKDILQLVDDNTVVFSPYKDEAIVYDSEKVFQRFGIKPRQIPEIIALMGDNVDNIPGISGIGEKTAVELINNFGSLEKILENMDKIKQEKLRKTITENLEKIKLNSELAILCDDVDIQFDLDKMKLRQPNLKELYRLFSYLEFKKFLKELPAQQDSLPEKINLAKLKDDELIIYGRNGDDMVIYSKGQILSLDGNSSKVGTLLSDNKIKKIGHDLKKVIVTLKKKGFSLEGVYFDTMIAAYLLNPSKAEYNLSDVSWDYLQEFPSAGTLPNDKALSLISRLKPVLEEELKGKSLIKLFSNIEMPLVEVLADMELSGIKLDLEVLKKLSVDLEKRLIELIKDIYEISEHQFNINSPKQLRQILFEKLKLPVIKKTKTGPSTDEEVLRTLAPLHKLPALLLEYRQLMKLKSTYVDTLPELIDSKTGCVHTSFNQTGTETGRLSSSNPNLQNIPVKTDIGRQIRRAIIAGGDNSLLAGDYSQIELRILAHISKDDGLTLAFKQDKDIHKLTASLIFGLEEKDITDSMREVAKRVNFGITYGLTSYGLARDLNISPDEAQRFIDSYFLRYPKVKDYMQEQIAKAEKDGFVTTLLGRRRYIPEIKNKNQTIRQFAQRKAVNTPIQGSASDLIKLAMIEIHKKIKQGNLKAKMVLQIHDELVFEVKNEDVNEFSKLVKDDMENVLKLDVPIRVVIKKGKNWLEMEEVR